MRHSMRSGLVAIMIAASVSTAFADTSCDTGVSSALDSQRQQFVTGQTSLANQGFSKRPGSFATTTCLDTLMQSGGMDILFKPPSLDTMLGMVKNLACAQASQIFAKLTGGGASSITSLLSGEISSGVNLNGMITSLIGSSTSVSGATSTTNVNTSLKALFQ